MFFPKKALFSDHCARDILKKSPSLEVIFCDTEDNKGKVASPAVVTERLEMNFLLVIFMDYIFKG